MPLKIKMIREVVLPASIISKSRWRGELEENLKKLKEYLRDDHEEALFDALEDPAEMITKASWVDEETEVHDAWEEEDEEFSEDDD